MSTTVEGIDAKKYLIGWLNAVTAMTIRDIDAIPEENWTQSFGGCTRGANYMLADTVTNLRWTIAAIKGEESDVYSKMSDLAIELETKTAAIGALNSASADFAEALSSASDEHLNSTVMAPWQMPTPIFMLAQISVNHIWYHDGQFNYIHSLLGDEKVYWTG